MSTNPDHSTPAPFHSWVYPLIIAMTTLVVFGQLMRADFLSWDDQFNIWQNTKLVQPTRDIAFYWSDPAFGLYIPFTYTIWGLIASVAHVSTPDPRGITLNPAIFHLANILVHIASGLLVYGILMRLIDRNHRAACFAAMLFAIHPIQVEPVAWVAGLKDVMAGMLALVAIWQYIAFAQEPRNKALHYSIALVAFILAMLSKPSAMMTPAIIFTIDWLMLRRPMKQILGSLAAWIVLAGVCAWIARAVQPAIGIEGAPIRERFFVVGDSLAFYLYKLVWPIDLAPDYGRYPAAIMGEWWFHFIWIIPAAVGVLLVLNRKRQVGLLAGGMNFVFGALPVLGFVTFLFQHFSTVADHYLYLSMFGVALAVGWILSRTNHGIVALVVGLWLSALGIRSYLQTRYWTSDFTIWPHTIAVNPRSFMARSNFGVVLIGEERYEDARQYLIDATLLFPDYFQAYDNLALVYEKLGQWDKAIETRKKEYGALRKMPQVAQANFDFVPVFYKLAYDYIGARNFEQARAHLDFAMKLDPKRRETLDMVDYLNEEMKKATTSPTTTPWAQ